MDMHDSDVIFLFFIFKTTFFWLPSDFFWLPSDFFLASVWLARSDIIWFARALSIELQHETTVAFSFGLTNRAGPLDVQCVIFMLLDLELILDVSVCFFFCFRLTFFWLSSDFFLASVWLFLASVWLFYGFHRTFSTSFWVMCKYGTES